MSPGWKLKKPDLKLRGTKESSPFIQTTRHELLNDVFLSRNPAHVQSQSHGLFSFHFQFLNGIFFISEVEGFFNFLLFLLIPPTPTWSGKFYGEYCGHFWLLFWPWMSNGCAQVQDWPLFCNIWGFLFADSRRALASSDQHEPWMSNGCAQVQDWPLFCNIWGFLFADSRRALASSDQHEPWMSNGCAQVQDWPLFCNIWGFLFADSRSSSVQRSSRTDQSKSLQRLLAKADKWGDGWESR